MADGERQPPWAVRLAMPEDAAAVQRLVNLMQAGGFYPPSVPPWSVDYATRYLALHRASYLTLRDGVAVAFSGCAHPEDHQHVTPGVLDVSSTVLAVDKALSPGEQDEALGAAMVACMRFLRAHGITHVERVEPVVQGCQPAEMAGYRQDLEFPGRVRRGGDVLVRRARYDLAAGEAVYRARGL